MTVPVATYQSALTMSGCCCLPVTRFCKSGEPDRYVCRCGKVTTPIPVS